MSNHLEKAARLGGLRMLSSFAGIHRTKILYALFAFLLLVEGLFYAFMLPFGQVPDEIDHYYMMEQEFGANGYVDNLSSVIYSGAHFLSLPFHSDVKVDQAAAAGIAGVRFNPDLKLTFHPRITLLRHLPGAIGFYLGVLLNLPMLTCTYLAEIFSVLFFAGMGYLILRTAPVKKEIFAFCLLIPVVLQQCSSVNYDAVMIPCSFLLFAYILKLYKMSSPIQWRHIFVVALLSLVLLVTKPPYVLIALTLLMIPSDRFSLKLGKRFELAGWIRRRWYIVVLLALAGVVGFLFLTRNSSLTKTVLSDLLHPFKFLVLLKNTLSTFAYIHTVQMVGVFGWLDSSVSEIYVLIFFMLLVYLNAGNNEAPSLELNPVRRGWILLLSAGIVLGILIALQDYSYGYFGWDKTAGISAFGNYISAYPSIVGIQGRYYIPCLPMVSVALSGATVRKSKKLFYTSQIIFYTLTFLYVMKLLTERYWI